MLWSEDIEYHTYNKWRKLGYQVQRGERSAKRSKKGKPLFSEYQVAKRTEYVDRTKYDYVAEDYDNYECWNDPGLYQD